MARTDRRTLPIIYTPLHQPHAPRIELSYNIVVDHPEVPERVEVMARALRQAGYADSFVEPREYPLAFAAKVHDESLIAFLEQTTLRLAGSDGDSVLETPYTISPDTPLAANTLEQAWLASCVVLTGADMLLSGSILRLRLGASAGAPRGALQVRRLLLYQPRGGGCSNSESTWSRGRAGY